MENKLSEIFNNLEKDIQTQQGSSPEIQAWNLNYFRNHRSRFRNDYKTMMEFYSNGKILELGSAPLHFTYLLKKLEMPVVGVDIEPDRFKDFISFHDLDVRKCNVETEKLPFSDGEFHLILFNEIFEHMRIDPINTLREIRRVLHPDGHLILSTPNLYSIPTYINFILGKGFDDPYEQFDKIEKFGHMGHVREYSVKQLKKFLRNTGYNPATVKLESHKPLRGMWTIFNPVRKIFPGLHAFQTHICRAQN